MDVRTLRTALALDMAPMSPARSDRLSSATVSEAAHEALDGVPVADIAPSGGCSGRTPTTERLSFGADFVAEQRQREGLED